MTHTLAGVCGGRLIVALEGGYNLRSIAESMAACVSVLLGDGVEQAPDDAYVPPRPAYVAIETPYYCELAS